MKYRITAVLTIAVLLTISIGNWVNCYNNGEAFLEDLKNEENIEGIIEDAGEFIDENIMGESLYIEAYGALQKAMFKHELNNFDLVEDKDGYLHSGNFYNEFYDDQKKIAINIRKLSDFTEEQGSDFLFALAPMKTVQEESRYIGIPYNDYNEAADDLLSYLRYYTVEYIDLRERLEKSDLSYEDSFFKTDHHWTTAAAFESYMALAEWINEHSDSELYKLAETKDIDNYEKIVYEDMMFGSQGRRSGLIYSDGQEDFEVYFPKEDGMYTVRYGTVDGYETREGLFSEVVLNDNLKDEVKNIYEDSCYDLMFLHGLSDYISIKNTENEDGEKVLMIRDSYSSPLGCYLAQNCGQLDMIYALGDDMDKVLNMIEDNDYDHVIMCIYPENLSIENLQLFEDLEYE